MRPNQLIHRNNPYPLLIHFAVTSVDGYHQHGWENFKLLKIFALLNLSTEVRALLLLPTILLKKIKEKPKASSAKFHILKFFRL